MLTACPHCGVRLKSLTPRCDTCGADLASDLVRPEFCAATTHSYDGTPDPGHAKQSAYQVSSPSDHLTEGLSSFGHSTISSSTLSRFLTAIDHMLLYYNGLIEGATWRSALFNVAFFSLVCIPIISVFLIGI